MDKREIEGKDTRRRHREAFKRELVERSLQPGASVSALAQEHGVNANLLFNWRRLHLRALAAKPATLLHPALLPVTVVPELPPVPYVSIEAAEMTPGDTAKPYDPPPEPSRRAGPTGFALGDRVSFDGGKGSTVIGMVAKINRRTASVATDDGRSWRVDFTLLRHVVEV